MDRSPKEDSVYDEKETWQRFEAALRDSGRVGHVSMANLNLKSPKGATK
jgi:hypothetical protein